MNLHDMVRGAITSVNADTPGAVYVSTGNANVRGILTPQFKYIPANLQVQAKAHKGVSHERGLQYTSALFTIYAYGDFKDIERPQGKGGDVCHFGESWYYISQVLEWWPDWCSFEVTKQLDATSMATLLQFLQNGENIGATP